MKTARKPGKEESYKDPHRIEGPPPDIPEWLDRVRRTVESEAPLMRTLMTRAINAVMKFESLSAKSAENAASAPSDMAVLLRALSSSEMLQDLSSVEPLAPAFVRGIHARRKMLDDHGGTLSSDGVAEILGITRQAVDKRRKAGKLLAVEIANTFRYPAWQFTQSGVVLGGLEQTLALLADHDEWMQVAFFVYKNDRLGEKSPVELLSAGQVTDVLDAAEVYGEHGAH